MKIVTWNCNMAFRKKAAAILEHQPDILVIPECEHPENLLFADGIAKPSGMLWFGNNRHKGLGIFSYNDFKLTVLDCHNPELRTIVPVLVTRKRIQFTLYAIWAYNPDDRDGCYVTQVWKAIHHYDHLLSNRKTMLIGDFNSNTIWDKPRREGNHSTMVEKLKKKGIHSVYHKHFRQKQGREVHPTFYLYKHKDKPYHLDYCFASNDLVRKLQSVEIGDYKSWSSLSDHVPVMATFKMGRVKQLLTMLFVMFLLISCKTRVKNYYIPEGFDGNVAVIYRNIEKDAPDDVCNYFIPDSGILEVNGAFEAGGVELNYYQENARGGYDTLEMELPGIPYDSTKSRIYFHRTLSYSKEGVEPIHVTAFYVGKKKGETLANDRIGFERKLEQLTLSPTH